MHDLRIRIQNYVLKDVWKVWALIKTNWSIKGEIYVGKWMNWSINDW